MLQTPKRTDHRQVPAIWNRVSLHKLNKDFFIYLFLDIYYQQTNLTETISLYSDISIEI